MPPDMPQHIVRMPVVRKSVDRPKFRCRDCSQVQDAANFRSLWAASCRRCERLREARNMIEQRPNVTAATYRRRLHEVACLRESIIGLYPESQQQAILRERARFEEEFQREAEAAQERAQTAHRLL